MVKIMRVSFRESAPPPSCLPPNEVRFIALVSCTPRLTMAEMGRALGGSSGKICKLADSLVGKGLVIRTKMKGSTLLELTALGAAIVDLPE